ncbi:MAG: LytTR family DNA-binding domain-containing protein, partial [Bacteroidota bacterium]
IVFTTAYSEYAVRSYEVEAVDYLLKPFEFDRFWQAVNKVKSLMGAIGESVQMTSADTYFFIGDGYKKVRLDFESILYVEGSGNYVSIHTAEQKVVSRLRIYEMLAKLPEESFIRVHNSFIVQLDKIDKIENNHVYIQKNAIPISAKYRDGFLKKIESLG